jgi:hypothetical protein
MNVNGTERLHRPVLVLNASYEPINICAARRALVLILKGVAAAEEHAPGLLSSRRLAFPLPSVIRLLEYRRIPHQSRALSRKNIMMRDKLHVPVLPQGIQQRGVDAGPRDSAVARRRDELGEPGGVLQPVQQPEGQPDAGRGEPEVAAAAAAVQCAHKPSTDAPAGERATSSGRSTCSTEPDLKAGARPDWAAVSFQPSFP